MKTGLQYTLRCESSETDVETRMMECALVRPDGTIAGTYKLTSEDDEPWTVEEISGATWDRTTGITTDLDRSIEYESDDDYLESCYEDGEVSISIPLPMSLAGLTEEEISAVYDCHEAWRYKYTGCARAVVAACRKLVRNNKDKRYTLEEAVRLVGILFYAAAETEGVISYDYIPAYDDEDAARVRHYPARHCVRTTGICSDELIRAVTILADLEPDDCDSDEDSTWTYFNA